MLLTRYLRFFRQTLLCVLLPVYHAALFPVPAVGVWVKAGILRVLVAADTVEVSSGHRDSFRGRSCFLRRVFPWSSSTMSYRSRLANFRYFAGIILSITVRFSRTWPVFMSTWISTLVLPCSSSVQADVRAYVDSR